MKKLSPKGALLISGCSMGTLGFITASLGPTLQVFAENTGSSLAAVGALLSCLLLGGLVTQLLGGPLNDRYGQRPVMLSSLCVMALGCAGMALSRNLWVLLACATLAGMGRGGISISAHLLVARVFAERSASALNMMNVFFGLGAITAPIGVSYALRYTGNGLLVLWCGIAMLLCLTPLMRLLEGPLPGVLRRGEPGAKIASPLRDPLLWICSVMLLFYVGGETGVGGWITTYLELSLALDTASAAFQAGSFWVAITVGRLLGAMLGTRLGAPRLLLICIIGTIVGALLIVLNVGQQTMSLVGVVVLGMSFGPIYPTVMAILTSLFPHAPGTAVSISSATGSLGGTFFPWMQGTLIEGFSPTAGMMQVLAITCMLLLLEIARRLVLRRRAVAQVRVEAQT